MNLPQTMLRIDRLVQIEESLVQMDLLRMLMGID
jgi:hypothetical protein